jgi:hypothetical protein
MELEPLAAMGTSLLTKSATFYTPGPVGYTDYPSLG